jgi:hypothetical protein
MALELSDQGPGWRGVLRSERGAALLEFAFAAPILIAFVIATAQIGIFFYARSGIKSAIGEGARYATIFPRPSNLQISARINDRLFGVDRTQLSGPLVTDCVVNSRPCVQIDMRYTSQVDFFLFSTPPITFVESRRAFVQR